MLKVFNTLGRKLEEFKSMQPLQVKFYQCGPTVYWVQHIGNMRAMVMADLVRRSLMYLGYDVRFVRNYTDVGHLTGDNEGDADSGEDRMEKGAKREGLTPTEIAQKYITIFEDDISALDVLPADAKPRATEYIPQIIDMVQELLDKGFAYTTPKAIYFDVTRAKDYTALSGQKLDLNVEGAGHGEVDDVNNKKHPADFAVWFFKTGVHKTALQYWPSPFNSPEVKNGEGFPGWHIECSVMSKAELGDTLDIHMGGVEHIPVHHPNEIAQSEAANGHKFVNYWLHNEHLTVNGGKMSKSEGTGIALSDIMAKGYNALDLRYFFLQAHYRSKQNFTWEALTAARTAYTRLRAKLAELFIEVGASREQPLVAPNAAYGELFRQALEEDFNIPQALAVAWDVLKADLPAAEKLETILDFDQVLGLELESSLENPQSTENVPAEAQKLIQERDQARADRDWDKADKLRDRLKSEFGIEVKDK